MTHDSRDFATGGSYPTFWDAPARQPATAVAPEQAYSEFVNLCEDEFPSGEYRVVTPTPATAD